MGKPHIIRGIGDTYGFFYSTLIKLYLNSSSYSITVEFLNDINIEIVKIFDSKGLLIRTYQVKGITKFEVQNLANGSYVYSAVLEKNQISLTKSFSYPAF